MNKILTENFHTQEYIKFISFFVINYLIAIPFFGLMIKIAATTNVGFLYATSLLLFAPLLILFMGIFASIKPIYKFWFALIWTFSAAILLESVILYLQNNSNHGMGNSIVFLVADWTLFLPVWLILGAVEYTLGFFLLKKLEDIRLSSDLLSCRILFNFWVLSAMTFYNTSPSFMRSSLVTIIFLSIVLTLGLTYIKKLAPLGKRRVILFIAFLTLFLFAFNLYIISLSHGFTDDDTWLTKLWLPLVSIGFVLPCATLTLIFNYKLIGAGNHVSH